MENQNSFKLVDGIFSAAEAKEILFSLVNSKLNFHQHEALSIKERFNGDISHSEKRIEELKVVYKNMMDLLSTASENGQKLKIHSLIYISAAE